MPHSTSCLALPVSARVRQLSRDRFAAWPVVLAVVLALVAPSLTHAEPDLPAPAKRKVDFAKDIQPLFVKHCIECHGKDKQESGLRLDRKSGPLGDSGKAIVDGKSAESLIVLYAAGADGDNIMPPDGKKLTDDEIALLRAWIDQGAERPDDATADDSKWSKHWAFQPIRRAPLPRVSRPEWVRNPIDAFVLARLDAAKIAPSPEADRTTLLRRLSLDLIGLPPTPEEVDAFLTDQSPEAYERLVDRLLASEHFGERWARHWLDLARYADSDGYEKDNPRLTAWKYRDWVINAFNRDMPFDQFTIEQLAGDLLPNATHDQFLATAFHRQTLTNTEGGTDQEQFRNEACFDRVATTATAWLGLTAGCAQCHTHKYDPITQNEYYRFFAFFNNGDEATRDIPTSETAWKEYEAKKAAHDAALQPLAAKRDALRGALASKQAEWEPALLAKLAEARKTPRVWHNLEIVSTAAVSGTTFERLDDGALLATGASPDVDTYTLVGKSTQADITALRVEVFADDRLPGKGPGRSSGGNFVLSELTLQVSDSADFATATKVALTAASADFAQKGFTPELTIDGKPNTGWAVGGQTGKNHTLALRPVMPLKLDPARSHLQIVIDQKHGMQHTLGHFRLQVATGVDINEVLPAEIVKTLDTSADKRTDAQRTGLLDYQLAQSDEGRAALAAVDQHLKSAPAAPVIKVAVINQRTANPRVTKLLRRGDFLQPQAEVQPGTFQILHPFTPREAGKPADRLDLARWLVDVNNPLTPRVAVNHLWQHLFGRGLVATVNDFGTRGEAPSHPELLDWLAADFVGKETGDRSEETIEKATATAPGSRSLEGSQSSHPWSRKALIKQIVMSATYRQSSAHRPELLAVDANNVLLHRQNRLRVEAEIVRDVHLTASGLLSRKVGGPSVFPPLPADVAALSYANNFKWTNSEGADRYRRGMYTFFKRTSPYPNLVAFDCPDGVTTAAARTPSNTPLQALATMNNEVFVETAQALAARILTATNVSASDDARITHAYRVTLSRTPTESERDRLIALVGSARDYYKQHPDDAGKLTTMHRPGVIPVEETAAWVIVSRVMLNFDEFVTRE